jgi:hypothetical protein
MKHTHEQKNHSRVGDERTHRQIADVARGGRNLLADLCLRERDLIANESAGVVAKAFYKIEDVDWLVMHDEIRLASTSGNPDRLGGRHWWIRLWWWLTGNSGAPA